MDHRHQLFRRKQCPRRTAGNNLPRANPIQVDQRLTSHDSPWPDNMAASTPESTQIGGGSGKNCADALPSFFVIGPPRTGTSWLYGVLRLHTVLPTPAKETRFFDRHFGRGIDWYRAHYSLSARNRPIGEIAPTYFASAEARERIASTTPDAKVVCTFRNPVERAVSLYRLKRAYGMVPWSFEESIDQDPELIESGKYATHLKAWQNILGASQVMATIYDDLRDTPQAYIDKLVDFIDVPRFVLTPSQIRYVHTSEDLTHPRNYFRTRSAIMIADWFKARRFDHIVLAIKDSPLRKLFLGGGPAFAQIPIELSQRLCELFRPEVEELENLLGRDLSAWKSATAVSNKISAASAAAATPVPKRATRGSFVSAWAATDPAVHPSDTE
jgi:hypothetical protein